MASSAPSGGGGGGGGGAGAGGDAGKGGKGDGSKGLESADIWGDDASSAIDPEILALSAAEIRQRTSMLANNIAAMRSSIHR